MEDFHNESSEQMSIRFRLLISYITMILVPIIFVVFTALLVALLFKGDIKEIKNIYLPPEYKHEISKNDKLYIDLHLQALKSPEKFTNQDYLNKMSKRLRKENGAGLIIRKGNNIIYTSSPSLKKLDKHELPLFGVFGDVNPVDEINNQVISIQKIDFLFPDQSEGTLFIITEANNLTKFVHSFFPLVFVSLILILIITNGLLTYFVSKTIIVPIKQLQKAAKQMKEGDLNIPIKPNSNDELGQLALDFDEMRIRLKESIDQQLAYEENRKELVANISHDLKTPITTIKGYIEGIRDGVANTPEKINRYLQTVYSKSIDLDHMIDELFLYSKLDLHRLPFHFEKIHFDQYLQDFVEELRFDVEGKMVDVDLTVENDNEYVINGDREHLKRVIMNIVNNSLKYIDKENKKLSFHLSNIDTKILFKMVDNGPGIAEENLPFIFDRFYRADMARGTEKGGSGLGLSIAKRIIEEHQGNIWAERKKGQGTTILFTLEKAGVNSEKDLNNRR
jgi:signal transduction histidine kinase